MNNRVQSRNMPLRLDASIFCTTRIPCQRMPIRRTSINQAQKRSSQLDNTIISSIIAPFQTIQFCFRLIASRFPISSKRRGWPGVYQAFFCFFLYMYPPAATIMMSTINAGRSRDADLAFKVTGIFMLSEMTVSPLTSVYFISLLIP